MKLLLVDNDGTVLDEVTCDIEQFDLRNKLACNAVINDIRSSIELHAKGHHDTR